MHRVLIEVYARASSEYRVISHLRLRDLLGGLAGREQDWRQILPLQRHSTYPLPFAAGDGAQPLLDTVRRSGMPVVEGGHTFYLGPAAWRTGPLASLAAIYPPDAGLKVMRNPGGIAEGGYLHGAHHSRVQRRILYGHPHLQLVANALYRAGVGPRLYDLAELQGDGTVWVAYVVQDVGGQVPSMAECAGGIARIRDLVAARVLSLVGPDGFAHPDFACPTCGGNAWIDPMGQFRFVDFQNFVLPDYGTELRRIAREAAEASHFGDRSILRGGAYLYQSVPGLGLPAKRDISYRIGVMTRLLDEAGATVRDRLVLDVGCNVGMMIGQYLRLGARWCHGWDQELVVPHADRLLSALGCTRYTLTGGMLQPDQDLSGNVPKFVRAELTGCVLSYLAVRGHIGWLNALRTVPWSTMIYEGHEGESESQTREHLEELRGRTGGTVAALASYRDGDSDPRSIAIIRRG